MFNLISYLLSIIFFVFLVVLGKILFNKEKKEKYSLLNHFPFELNKFRFSNYIIGLMLLVTILLLMMHGNMFLISPTIHVNIFLSNVIGIVGIITNILLFIVFYFKIEKSFITYIGISIGFSLFVLAFNILGIFYILRSDIFNELYIIIYSLFIILYICLLIYNFIKGFEKFEKIENDNNIIYKRGKINAFSLLQWGSIFIYFASNIIYLILNLL